tara:strand:+ start:541 stop:723 length:183 start_codon:yes stop_codon:yes gene_type:complete
MVSWLGVVFHPKKPNRATKQPKPNINKKVLAFSLSMKIKTKVKNKRRKSITFNIVSINPL